MLFRLKNHLIWTPEDFPIARQSLPKILLTDLNRPGGLPIPPERIEFSTVTSGRRGQPRTFPFCFNFGPVLHSLQNPFLSLSQTHFSLFSSTIHLLLHFSFSFSNLYIYLLTFWTPNSDSPRQGALGRTDIFKLRQS